MILSIGMIVKNEGKNLERCLTSLKPILESVDSELIIADTGSTDNTVEIAKKFTDNVFYFEWINNFAAARNSTLDRAKGEWYMFIDGDEFFQSCDEIIRFFNSGEYKKYTLATYIQRNYTHLDNYSEYSDHNALRLCKIVPELRFKGIIHETFALENVVSIIKFLPTVADHFGYAYTSDPELEEKKIQRNLKLLLELAEQGPLTDHPLVYKQIADCYSLNDSEKALEYVNKGLDELRGNTEVGFSIIDYYAKKAQLLFRLKRYNEVIEVCDEFLSPFNPIRKHRLNADIEMRLIRANALKHLNRYNESIQDYAEFFKLFRDEKRGKMDTPDKLLANRIFSAESNLMGVLNDFSLICVITGKYGTLDEYIRMLPIKEYSDKHEYIDFRINLQLEIMNHLGYKDLQKFYNQLDDYGKQSFNKYSRHGLFFTNRQDERINAILKLKTEDTSLIDVFRMYQTYFSDNSEDNSAIFAFAEKYGYEKYPELLYIMLYINADIAAFVNNSFFTEKYAKDLIANYPDFIDIFSVYDISEMSSEGLEGSAVLAKAAIFFALDKKKPFENLLKKYGSIGDRWRSEFPGEENIPADIQAAIAINNILSARSRKDYKLCISEMRRLIQISPEFAPIVKNYQQLIRNELKPVRNERSELAEMAASVKHNIRSMISSGNIASAVKALLELEKLLPGDPEIEMLKEEIEKSGGLK